MRRFVGRTRWFLPAASCVVFALLAFLIALRYTLPYDDLAQSVETRLRSQGIRAKIEGLGPGSLFGVRADRVTLAGGGSPEWKTELRDVIVKISLPNLFRFRLRAAMEAAAFGGKCYASWPVLSPNEASVDWHDLDLRRIPLPPNVATVNVRGFAEGTAEARRGKAGDAWVAGFAEGGIRDARFGPGSVGGLPLPAISLGNGKFRLLLRDGKLLLETFKFEGGNLRVDVNGSVGLGVAFPRNPVEGVLSLRPDERAAADLGFFLSFFPGGRSSDGAYTGRVSGTLAYMSLTPMAARR